jgi:hypothetical protein
MLGREQRVVGAGGAGEIRSVLRSLKLREVIPLVGLLVGSVLFVGLVVNLLADLHR